MDTQILVVGAGTGGIMTAAQLKRKMPGIAITIVDPAEYHYYQPAWTLVGAGAYNFDKPRNSIKNLIPKGVKWVRDAVTAFDPANNAVALKGGDTVTYEYLVVSPGLVIDAGQIEGLSEALGKGVVCSNYTNPRHTWSVLQNFKGGNAVFTSPTTPVKCGGATQKIAYLSADYLGRKKIANPYRIVLASPGTVVFGIRAIADTLTRVVDRYGIVTRFRYAPVKVDGVNRTVTFRQQAPGLTHATLPEPNPAGERVAGDATALTVEMDFDMLHIAPPQAAPGFVRTSPLANDKGWLDVDPFTLQHNRYANIFGIGDAAGLPTAKTGAAIRKQVPVVVDNLVHRIHEGRNGELLYNGYSSCPIVTGYGRMVLAEFDYDNNFTPDPKLKQMLIADSSKEHWRLWMLKKYMLPWLYWNKMMKGLEV